VLPSRYSDLPLQPGDTFRLETPGGGGYGNPLERDPDVVVSDVASGYVSQESARESYGVVVRRDEKGSVVLDAHATEALRNERTRNSPAADTRVPALAQEVIAE
jgi:N-methylhydantoinase B